MNRIDPADLCPATGQNGLLDFSAAGDEWYVKCHICGTTWMGGSQVLEPHEDRRPRSSRAEQISPRDSSPRAAGPGPTAKLTSPSTAQRSADEAAKQENHKEEPGGEANASIIRELYTGTFEEALGLVQAARTLGFGFQLRNSQDVDGEEGFDVILYRDVPLSVDGEDLAEARSSRNDVPTL
ncbi:hypothetical protein [Kitasatospora sp. NPDC059327]|uniref:hypothetical protein n=1 Tax=Kitasatospora sp. NPDC059327 TaxID=3346803 RepID=UPI0036BD11A0